MGTRYVMSYAHPEVLVNTEWLSQNPPNANRKLVEVDYDPVNGYQKGHISGASLIWWKRDINDPVTRDIISKKEFEALMSKNGSLLTLRLFFTAILITGLRLLFSGFLKFMAMKI